jgi:hypothetical protein
MYLVRYLISRSLSNGNIPSPPHTPPPPEEREVMTIVKRGKKFSKIGEKKDKIKGQKGALRVIIDVSRERTK